MLMMKYKCPDCGEIFEGELAKCPKCGKEFAYSNKVEVIEPVKARKGNPFLGVAIASIIVSVLTMTIYPLLLFNLVDFGEALFEGLFTSMVPGLWNGMVREFFTFIFFIIIVFLLIIGVLLLLLIIFALGPLGFIVSLILAIISIARTRKWYSIVAISLAATNIIIDILMITWFLQSVR